MHLVHLLLPLYDPSGSSFPAEHFHSVRKELTERFGGLTAYSRAPAEGLWADEEGEAERDDIVVYEVMVDGLDRDWWSEFRERLEKLFEQEEMVIRAVPAERL